MTDETLSLAEYETLQEAKKRIIRAEFYPDDSKSIDIFKAILQPLKVNMLKNLLYTERSRYKIRKYTKKADLINAIASDLFNRFYIILDNTEKAIAGKIFCTDLDCKDDTELLTAFRESRIPEGQTRLIAIPCFEPERSDAIRKNIDMLRICSNETDMRKLLCTDTTYCDNLTKMLDFVGIHHCVDYDGNYSRSGYINALVNWAIQQKDNTDDTNSSNDNNSATASQPANVATAESETTAQPEIVKFEVGKTYRNDSPDFCYGASYTITGKSKEFVSFESYFFRKQAYKKLRIGTDRNGILCEYFDDKEKGSPYPAQYVYATALDHDVPNNEDAPVAAATTQTESAPAIIYGMSDVEKALRRIKSKSSRKKSQHTPAENAQPENLYDDGSFSDAPGDNSSPEQDIPEGREAEAIPDDNPGFTVVPSCEIKHTDYTAYPEAIHDDIPCVNVPACNIPTIAPRTNPIIAALLFVVYKFILPVIFMRKKDIRRDNTNPFMFSVGYKYPAYFHDKKQLLTVNERYSDKFGFSWLSVSDEDNISYSVRVKLRDDSYTELIDFKELERTCFAFQGWKPIKESNRAKYVKFEVGKSYTAHHRYAEYNRHFTILDRFAAVPADRPDAKHKTVWLKVRMSDSRLENEPVDGWTSVFVNREHNSEEYWSTSEFIFRADQPDVVQEIPALTPEITHEHKAQQKTRKPKPAPASDLEHKLIDTKDLHFADKRRALDHNTTVITSCMFPEAVISLLMSISPQAIIQLGVHMRLFIAKPKGKKIAIAELFAKKLMASRELRAHVRTNSEIISAKSTASIPDGVKFIQLKHRQLGFIFTE